ncbi:hypothetical protein OQA88_8197 [Cercophora sp. LCS_1]
MAFRAFLKKISGNYRELSETDTASYTSSSSSFATTTTIQSEEKGCGKPVKAERKQSDTQFGLCKNWQEPSVLDVFLPSRTVRQMDRRFMQRKQLERDRAFMLRKVREMGEKGG